ncbi:uncharacterized protein F5Z01DRAFT_649433 [Emericellopsis atlantica]|uniref:UDP-glucuronic acid decarboxylase 1 n=1 Tax=Emericellopsis atlantica TaxID=2614577 RepID=A0A9P7ZQ13_9HYPO|nr:uncharacterized protein F5Z01DRAFT_649433 [Emericellopsis atlantica]KAG9256193.1 hypothetical protein F5Z01DRAFT_649433 [Emericellopsis atlantica]
MAVLVTGGAGFLGHHLVKLLLDEGKEVIVFDNLWTGSAKNVRYFEKHPSFTFKHCDIRERLPDVGHIEQIYHLACPASPDRFEESPVEILETCFQGTKNIFDLGVKRGARVLIASTSETYGDPLTSPQSEQYRGNVNCFGPRSCYDEGKRIAESLAYAYHHKHGLQVRIARIFNAYGPQMQLHDGRAVPNFIASAMEGQSIVVYGDGNATRCFQYASDCVEGLHRLMNSDHDSPVNIGSDVEMPIGLIADMVARVVAEKMGQANCVDVTFLPQREDDPTQRQPDIGLAKRVLGWAPKVELEEGLDRTVDWFLAEKGMASGSRRAVGGAITPVRL